MINNIMTIIICIWNINIININHEHHLRESNTKWLRNIKKKIPEHKLKKLWGECDYLAKAYRSNAPKPRDRKSVDSEASSYTKIQFQEMENGVDSQFESGLSSGQIPSSDAKLEKPTQEIDAHEWLLSPRLVPAYPGLYGSFSLPNVLVNVEETDMDSVPINK